MSRALFRPIFETLFETTSAAPFHDFRKTLEGAKPGIYDTFPMFWAPFFAPWSRPKSDLFHMEGSQTRQIAVGSQVRSKTRLLENYPKGCPFRAPPRGSRRRKYGRYQYLSTLADMALEAVRSRFEDLQNPTPEAEVSCFAVLAGGSGGNIA